MSNLEKIKSNAILINIRSYYNIKKIFEYLEDKKALNVIIYNKVLQDMLVVDIEYYKYLSGKYKIGGKNGLGKILYYRSNDYYLKVDF